MKKTTVSSQRSIECGRSVYRGIHARHPVLAEALLGIVIPGNLYGSVTPEQHNRGNVSDISPYTSWTSERETAEYHARRFVPGGVILTLPSSDAETHHPWSWERSPDIFEEQEILLRGPRSGATVELL